MNLLFNKLFSLFQQFTKANTVINVKLQDDNVEDSTISVTGLASELLRDAEHLEQKNYPQAIKAGWRKVVDVANENTQQFKRRYFSRRSDENC